MVLGEVNGMLDLQRFTPTPSVSIQDFFIGSLRCFPRSMHPVKGCRLNMQQTRTAFTDAADDEDVVVSISTPECTRGYLL